MKKQANLFVFAVFHHHNDIFDKMAETKIAWLIYPPNRTDLVSSNLFRFQHNSLKSLNFNCAEYLQNFRNYKWLKINPITKDWAWKEIKDIPWPLRMNWKRHGLCETIMHSTYCSIPDLRCARSRFFSIFDMGEFQVRQWWSIMPLLVSLWMNVNCVDNFLRFISKMRRGSIQMSDVAV